MPDASPASNHKRHPPAAKNQRVDTVYDQRRQSEQQQAPRQETEIICTSITIKGVGHIRFLIGPICANWT